MKTEQTQTGMTQEEINNRYWNELTYKSSGHYIRKMHELDDIINEGNEDLRRDDSYHGHNAPMHMMYKLGTLHRKGEPHGCGYEFLIEYDKDEPTVGIYYGCKCLFPEGVDPAPYISQFNEEWESVRNEICTLLNNIFPEKDFSHRFKMTNNANNGTYWPFWITLYEDEDICDVGLRATKIIREVYKRMLEKRSTQYEKPKPKNTRELTLTAFTEKAYDDFVTSITKKLYPKDIHKYESEVCEILKRFIKEATDKGFIYDVPSYERAWAITLPAVDFAFLIEALFDFIGKNIGTASVISPQWQNVCRVFLDKEERPWGKDVLKQFRKVNDAKAKANEAQAIVAKWLS